MKIDKTIATTAVLLITLIQTSVCMDIGGLVSIEARTFYSEPIFPERKELLDRQSAIRPSFIYPSITVEPKFDYTNNPGWLKASFDPYFRYDKYDTARTLVDIHGLYGDVTWNDLQLKVGYSTEFWGVLEFVNLVNVLNQDDLAESFLTKRKLGQPMAVVTIPTKVGAFEIYGLSMFNPLRFPGPNGRFRPPLPVEDAEYGSAKGRRQAEWAIRYQDHFEDVSFAVSHFYGYARQPEMLLKFDSNFMPYLVPHYFLQNQSGIEGEYIINDIIIKTEDVIRFDSRGKNSTYGLSGGFEYSLSQIGKYKCSPTLVAEYLYDTRERSLLVPFTDDVFLGVKFNLNNNRSTEFTVSTNLGIKGEGFKAITLNASSRITDRIKCILAYRSIQSANPPFNIWKNDSYFDLRSELYF